MAALVCLVKQLQPVALATLAGTLDDRSSLKAGLTLRDCLAAAPTAVIIDTARLRVVGERAFAWLDRICREAEAWPGVPVYFVDPAHVLEAVYARRFADTDSAMAAAIEQPVFRSQCLTFPPVAASCAAVRAAVRDACAGWGLGRLAQAGELIASELVANGVIHAGTNLEVTIRAARGLQISVADRDPRLVPVEPHYHGTGMEIVAGLADRWGCLPTSTGKVVWACLNGAAPTGRLDSPGSDA
jgi:hypothetical protein